MIKKNKIKSKCQKLYDYIQFFQGELRPRGEGARFEAGHEFYTLAFSLLKDYKSALGRNDKETANYITSYLLEVLLRTGLDFIDHIPEEYQYL